MPLTVAAGRSGVCGASMPVHGGVVLDLTALDGIVAVDDTSLVLDVRAGTFGTPLEAALRAEHGVTLGHWPQSIDLSTVGGWLACRSAGQLSTRYGKIEDMVLGLDVVLADGRTLHTGGAPRAAVGPDLTQVFVGSEGTLGIITGARLRVHPAPTAEVRAAYRFPTFVDGLDACRRILRRGATPAVLRLYDAIEGDRHFGTGDATMLLVLDEGDPALLDGVLRVVHEECATRPSTTPGCSTPGSSIATTSPRCTATSSRARSSTRWRWRRAGRRCPACTTRCSPPCASSTTSRWRRPTSPTRTPTARASTSPSVASRRKSNVRTATAALWDAAMTATLRSGAALSHHHGIGLNRARDARAALGAAYDVLLATKTALDPHGILNPGKLGLPSPWGDPAWP